MKKLKQHLYKSQMNYAQKQLQITNQVVEPATKPRFQFSKGLIVKICFDTPIRDGNHLNQFKVLNGRTGPERIAADVTQFNCLHVNSSVMRKRRTKWNT